MGVGAPEVRERVAVMHRTRRLASIAVIAMVGAVALAGCRSEPGVAAYFGDQEITEDQVTEVIEDAKVKLPEPSGSPDAGASPDPALPPGAEPPKVPSRADVLSAILLTRLCEKFSAERGYQPQEEVPVEQVAAVVQAPADSRYARDAADLFTCLLSIPLDQSVRPTEEELADLVARARTAPGVVPPDTPDDAVANQLSGGQQYIQALTWKRALAQAAVDYDLTVNPRYRPLERMVLSFRGNVAAVAVPLGEAGPDTVVEPKKK